MKQKDGHGDTGTGRHGDVYCEFGFLSPRPRVPVSPCPSFSLHPLI